MQGTRLIHVCILVTLVGVIASCGNDPYCPEDLSWCWAKCVDLMNDESNCGSCGNSCGQGGSCNNGNCAEFPVWIEITGGSYMMGSPDGVGEAEEHPQHLVTLPSFSLTKTEITVAQYSACVDMGVCSEPETDEYCNWDQSGRDDHPINCVDWTQAVDYCESWMDGKLPSESEWEYAARNQGQDLTYPWGDVEASCEYSVMNESPNLTVEDVYRGCEEGRTWPVCSKPEGNTVQGLCDMSGNVGEWVQDFYHENYDGAPTDGSPWGRAIPYTGWGIRRGGSFYWGIHSHNHLRSAARDPANPERTYPSAGFRCANPAN